MQEIILTPDQAKTLSEAAGSVVLKSADGHVVAYTSRRFTVQEIEEAERDRDSDPTRYTTREVLDHLRSLE
jgi:hypothetical protein